MRGRGCLLFGAIAALVLSPLSPSSLAFAQENKAAQAARDWRVSHEREILAEYFDFLRIPNVSRDLPNVRRNALHIRTLMEKRGIRSRLLELPGVAPVVYGEILSPGAKHTYVFYAHYDGQPVTPSEWATPPFEPVYRTARLDRKGVVAKLPPPGTPLDPEWRIYARSASDDKAQIAALLNAVDALKSAGMKPVANIKFVFEGEEEEGSPNLERILRAHRQLLKADLWLICDGPEHSSGRQTVTFGARGIQSLEITVYGAKRELHSGHYGNWAPNPAMMLAQLLASMKDSEGRVTIDHFYDGVVPLTEREKQAIDEIPRDEPLLMQDFWMARADGGGRRLAELINLPALNIRGMASAHVGDQASNIIPSTATAAIDLRLVKGVTAEGQARRVIDHIVRQGFHVTRSEPDESIRRRHPKVAKVVVSKEGYEAVRTPMDLPAALRVVDVVRGVRGPVVLQPTMGGSVPLDMIERVLGTHTILMPLVNHDNNQHSRDENLRLRNFWQAIETQAALLMME